MAWPFFSFVYNKILLWGLFIVRCGLPSIVFQWKVLFEISPPILNFCKDQGSKEFKHIIMMITLIMLVKFLSAHLCMYFAKHCRVYVSGHYLSTARSAASSLDFCLAFFYFISLLYCIFSVEINCQYICQHGILI